MIEINDTNKVKRSLVECSPKIYWIKVRNCLVNNRTLPP